MTQGDIISHTIFEVVMDSVVRHWLSIVCDTEEPATVGLDVQNMGYQVLLYADDGPNSSHDAE